MDHIDQILKQLQENNLMLQPQKCSFCKLTFEILGFVATKDRLKPNPKKIQAIKNYSLLKTPKEVERFLGMVTWLKRFIIHLSRLIQHLRLANQQDLKGFKLSKEVKRKFELLKEILSSETCMAHPNFTKPFYIHVDVSKGGLGVMLIQLDDKGHHQVIEYALHALTSMQ